MGISIGQTNPYIDAINSQAQSNVTAGNSQKINYSINNLSASSTKEELTEAVKSFEQYFVEEMLKTMKESSKVFSSKGESDALTNYYMDFAISDVAKQMVDQYGGRITEDFVAQIQRNYGITETDE